MVKRTRKIDKKVFFSEDEMKIINEKMAIAGIDNFSAFCRKMTVDGYVIKQDFTRLKELTFEINKIGNNINQIAKNVNINNNVSNEQLKEINNKVDEIWHILKSEILKQP